MFYLIIDIVIFGRYNFFSLYKIRTFPKQRISYNWIIFISYLQIFLNWSSIHTTCCWVRNVNKSNEFLLQIWYFLQGFFLRCEFYTLNIIFNIFYDVGIFFWTDQYFSTFYGKKVDFSPISCKKPFYTRSGHF